jgi:tripartite-type tricarboxylate transporter receptor subunit TctC
VAAANGFPVPINREEHSMRGKLFVLVLALTLVALPSVPSLAQSWPQRTVRVIVPNPAGVGMDIVTRLFTERLSERWGQAVVVENIPGADGTLAAREFVAKRDNHTLLFAFPGLISINPLTYDKLPYDPAQDLVPIASASDNFLAIAASANLKAGTLDELIHAARARPTKLNWAATPGLPHFAFAGLQKRAGIDSVQVPYRDFNQAIADLGEGRIDAVSSGVAPLLPHAQSGKIRLVAFVNATRSPAAPDIPTLPELGYADFSFSGVTGFFGWRDMPAGLRDRISKDVREIAADQALRDRLSKMGSASLASTPEEFAAIIAEQRRKIEAIDRLLKGK